MTDKTEILPPLAQPMMARRSTLRALALGSLAAIGGTVVAAPAAQAAACPWPDGSVQEGWRWCSKCQGMFYSLASAGKGVCPKDHQPHTDAGSGHYYERIGTDVASVQQGGWCWCSKCAGFFYGRASVGAGGMGACPAGGLHTKAGSGAYAAVIGEDATGQQGGWRWCQKCMGMWYARATGNPTGACAGNGTDGHIQSGSGHYASLD